jgi:SAM-dependent methyltransferase
MNSYDVLSPIYDVGTGNRTAMATLVRRWITKHRPQTTRVLDLACGTGAILRALPRNWEVWGVDLSQGMLQRARQRVPRGHFFRQDMTRFRLPQKFDAIICLLDSINHVIHFAAWEQMFRRVGEHLEDGGIFVFDVYTVRKLRRLGRGAPFVRRIGRDYFMVTASCQGRGRTSCEIRIFQHLGRQRYRLLETHIQERSFSLSRIRNALRKHFSRVHSYGEGGRRPSERLDRVYFVCGRHQAAT